MPSPATSERMLQYIPSFSQTQAEFLEDEITIRKCIATPHGKECGNLLTAQRQRIAASVITQDAATLELHDIRTIITLLLCEHCQKNNNHRHKNKLADKWQSEFPAIDLGIIEWRKDEYSLSRSATPTTTPRRTSSNTVSTESSARSALDVDAPDAYEVSPTPSARRARRERPHNSVQAARRPPLRPGHIDRRTSSVQEHVAVDGVDPSAVSQALNVVATSDRSFDDSNSGAADTATADEPMPDAPPVPIVSAGPFFPGSAARWTPEMIIDNVENLLTSNIPAANRGAIYAFQQLDGPHIKIGYTTQSCSARRTQISDASGIKLLQSKYVWRANIELRLLLRLEKLVHADLAYAQRNLRIVGAANTRKTQHEWFEVDYDTASQSIDFWYDVVHHQDDVVKLDDTIDRSSFAVEDGDDPRIVNADHARRLQYWKKRIIIPQAHSLEDTLKWMTGCGILGLIPVVINIPDLFVFPFFVFGIAVWTRLFTGRRWI
ncbi:hypothetical protein AMS68_006387 [Peltaster fructicola]|uniref:Bacteriophage T5 Orf172 DNA-binding domain-containing protein n=1 Tax=Peltaster fructicola TaxID=286661 RepID=A0A6H0Y2K6_9PEZI|nr:hypothetical protein AMS68_006387 [Peltaster fructicola]